MNARRPLLLTTIAVLAIAHAACVGGPAARPPTDQGRGPRSSASAASTIEVTTLDLAVPAESRSIPLRLAYPTQGRQLPIVLFSHGAYSSKDEYAPILDAWAGRGYVVIAMTHRDSTALGVKRGAGDPRYFVWRLDDGREVLAQLDEILERVPGVRGRADLQRIAATGHSFGGLVAQTLAGGTFFDPAPPGRTVSRRDPRIRAAIVFSGAGPFPPTVRDSDFLEIRVPLLVTVGTNDLKQAPDLTGYEWRRKPFDLAPADGTKYLLILHAADHYLGGRVGRSDLQIDPRSDGYLTAFVRTSSLFLDAYLRGAAAAERTLRSTGVRQPPGATLTIK